MEADNVVAENCVAVFVPDVERFASVAEVTLTVGSLAVPPVKVFIPLWTRVVSTFKVCANIEYKSVDPDKIVPPDNVVAENCIAVFVPDVERFAKVAEVTLTVGAFAVPPVKVFIPPWTRVTSPDPPDPIGENIE